MLTTVILEGAMGKAFGRKWELAVSSPNEALRLINANKPGLFNWIREKLTKYGRYKVIVEREDGRVVALDNDTYALQCNVKKIRFVPLIEGASAGIRFVVGALLIAASFIPGMQAFSPYLVSTGASLMLGSVIEMLTPKIQRDANSKTDKTSHYFNGPVNTVNQGVPVPLIYGRSVRVGSHAISASVTVDQVT